MNRAIEIMLERYELRSVDDYEGALREVLQEITLLGLWRGKFFEHAVFYGGTALRLFYGLDRFSEDLDFSLINPKVDFRLVSYFQYVVDELQSFGFTVSMQKIEKQKKSAIDSAFLKANTRLQLVKVGLDESVARHLHHQKKLTIKIEVDCRPPLGFLTEAKYLLNPIEFSVKLMQPSFLFAGKMHALLCRQWANRVKGRDWYDWIWYVKQGIPLNLHHLERRMRQTDHIDQELTESHFFELLLNSIEMLDVDKAKKDVLPFIKNPQRLDVWSKDFFHEIASLTKIDSRKVK